MKLWITGSKGFLGRSFQNWCKHNEIPFVSTSKEEVDVTSIDQVKSYLDRNSDITNIINCAALAHVDLAEENPTGAFKINVIGPENLGKLSSERTIPVVHFSTEYIFNGNQYEDAFTETHQPKPIGVYAQTKREGELRLISSASDACIIRTSWLFGGSGKTFLSSLFEKIKNEDFLRADNEQKGKATYIEDLNAAIFALINQRGIFHFANHGKASRYEIAVTMRQYALDEGISIACQSILPMQSMAFVQINKRPRSCILDTSKIERFLGMPIRSWGSAVRDLVVSNHNDCAYRVK